MRLYAATSNANKLAEFQASAATGVEVAALPGLAAMPEPVEDASTFVGNAVKKAVEYSRRAPGSMVFADDSGLEVEGIDGLPGVRSARFAEDMGFGLGSGLGKDGRNNACLLEMLAARPGVSRVARYVCVLALARDGEVLLTAEGEVGGEILETPKGTAGFGYDPLFLVPALGRSMAELSREEKWEWSHRGKAFRLMLQRLVAHAGDDVEQAEVGEGFGGGGK